VESFQRRRYSLTEIVQGKTAIFYSCRRNGGIIRPWRRLQDHASVTYIIARLTEPDGISQTPIGVTPTAELLEASDGIITTQKTPIARTRTYKYFKVFRRPAVLASFTTWRQCARWGHVAFLDSSNARWVTNGASPKKANRINHGTNHGNGDYGGPVSQWRHLQDYTSATTNPGAVLGRFARRRRSSCALLLRRRAEKLQRRRVSCDKQTGSQLLRRRLANLPSHRPGIGRSGKCNLVDDAI